ncbi:hypothetical protein [Natronolimnobius sp. AArcel1]|uniref:hypothetical protein n=1 Tax=Natronolimnobius sp. AArcel1 TaxID=1679093 RepID=UPI0019CFA8DC|nr:hypothetical protein [Natronolimnobius sp. AArcel1]
MSENTDPRPDNDSLLGRRSYLKVAAGAAALGIASTGAAADEDYDVVEVSAGDTYSVNLGDGDTLENTLIDITARNAQYQINASGSDWEIRNVGVHGEWDGHQKAEPLIASVSSGGVGRIENLYLGDGTPDDTYPGATGIYVANSHAGVLEIDRVNIQGYPDNAIYGSSPGDLPHHTSGEGGGGEVHITNSYAADCRAGGFRIGSPGSYAENCVAVGCDRNFWGFYHETEAIDCDFSDARFGDIGTGDGHWGHNATVTVTNTRYDTTVNHSGQISGSSAGSPERTEPDEVDGVPLSAEDAASGSSSSSPDEGDESEDDEDEIEGHVLAFVTDPDARNARYEFTAEGAVEFYEASYESPSGGHIEGGTYEGEDFIDDDGDAVHAGGVTGGGHGDAFIVDGAVTDIDLEESDLLWVELDGEEKSIDEIIEETGGEDEDDQETDTEGNLLAFVTEPDAENAGYEFTTEGAVEFTEAPYESPSGGRIEGGTYSGEDFIDEDGDTVHAGGITGGGHGDAFLVDGAVTDIDLEQPDVMWIELDGEEMSVEEIIEETGGADEDDEETDTEGNLLSFVTEPDARNAGYEFTAEGAVEFTEAPYESPSGGSIEGGTYTGQDFIDEDGDTVHAGGITGGGHGDAFLVEGSVTDITLEQPDVMWVELGGEEMSVDEIIEETGGDDEDEDGDDGEQPSKAIVIDSTETGAEASYTFEVSGTVEKATHRDASIDDSDIIDGNRVEGSVDDSRDAYWFSGDITDFWLNGDAYVDIEYNAR